MKKLIVILLGVLLLSACDGLLNVEPQKKCEKETPRTPQKWIVEKKINRGGRRGFHKHFYMSNVNDMGEIKYIAVGDYTFEKTNLGDTIIY